MAEKYDPSNWSLTKRLLGYVKPYLGTYAMINVTAFGREGIYSLVAPLLVMLIIDYALVPAPGATNWFLELLKAWTGVSDRYGLLIILSSLMILLAVIRSIFFVVHRYLRGVLSQNIIRDMRGQLYNALINKSFGYLGQVRTGQIISRVTSDMNAIDMFYSETVREAFRMSLQLALTIAVLMTMSLRLTIITLLPLPVVFLTTRLYMGRARERMSATRAQLDSLNSVLIEGISAQKLI